MDLDLASLERYLAERERPRVIYTAFSLNLRGILWSGRWRIDGTNLSVESAYGGKVVKLGRADPALKAERVLLQILRERLEGVGAGGAVGKNSALEVSC